jgi:hypothetical protein
MAPNKEQEEADAVENYRKLLVSRGYKWLGYEVDDRGVLVVKFAPPAAHPDGIKQSFVINDNGLLHLDQ